MGLRIDVLLPSSAPDVAAVEPPRARNDRGRNEVDDETSASDVHNPTKESARQNVRQWVILYMFIREEEAGCIMEEGIWSL